MRILDTQIFDIAMLCFTDGLLGRLMMGLLFVE